MRIVAKGHIILSRRLNGAFYDEKCPCPSDLDTFYSDYKCPESFDQLDADMAKFPGTFDLDELLKKGKEKHWMNGGHGDATAHIIIKDQRLFVKDLGSIMGFRPFLTR